MGIKALLIGVSFMCEYCRGRYRCRRESQSDIFFAVCIYCMYCCHMYMCVIDKWAV